METYLTDVSFEEISPQFMISVGEFKGDFLIVLIESDFIWGHHESEVKTEREDTVIVLNHALEDHYCAGRFRGL